MSDIYLLDTNILVHLIRGDQTGMRLRDKYTPSCPDLYHYSQLKNTNATKARDN